MGNLSGPATRAHLEMIQGVVNRLSHNSFLLKGWSVVLVSAMFALSARDSAALFVYLAYFPAIDNPLPKVDDLRTFFVTNIAVALSPQSNTS